MQSLSYGLRVATSNSPELEVVLNPSQKRYFENSNLVSGVVTLNTPFDLTHEGIKVTLRGEVQNKSNEVYYGARQAGLMGAGQTYKFI